MISINELNSIKTLSSIQINLTKEWALYAIVENNTVVWQVCSDSIKEYELKIKNNISANNSVKASIKEKEVVSENIPASVYGFRMKITSIPITNEEGICNGAFVILLPKIHNIEKSFKEFAPMITEMFPEGAFLSLSDGHYIVEKQPSSKFDMPAINIGFDITVDDTSIKAIETGEIQRVDIDTLDYGSPVRVLVYPLHDDETNEVVGSMNVIRPKQTELTLRNMSENLQDSLTGISSTIEELTASSSSIHENQQLLNNDIDQIIEVSNEIDNISSFIKELANETKMLGLNAAIEAARAGEVGRGFGIVAQEIRRLSDESKSTVPKIQQLTNKIKNRVNEVHNKSQYSLSATQEQTAATEEISASIQEIAASSDELANISMKL